MSVKQCSRHRIRVHNAQAVCPNAYDKHGMFLPFTVKYIKFGKGWGEAGGGGVSMKFVRNTLFKAY